VSIKLGAFAPARRPAVFQALVSAYRFRDSRARFLPGGGRLPGVPRLAAQPGAEPAARFDHLYGDRLIGPPARRRDRPACADGFLAIIFAKYAGAPFSGACPPDQFSCLAFGERFPDVPDSPILSNMSGPFGMLRRYSVKSVSSEMMGFDARGR